VGPTLGLLDALLAIPNNKRRLDNYKAVEWAVVAKELGYPKQTDGKRLVKEWRLSRHGGGRGWRELREPLTVLTRVSGSGYSPAGDG
jgi:hypothetical protein